jgi:probable phosphoglycerate mutase
MTALLLVRHAPTPWNEAGRLQGRADPPLSAAGRDALASWRLPIAFIGAPLRSSPLRRARETAAAFGDAVPEPRLIEMDWGAWEGCRLVDLRRRDPAAMAALEVRGLDLRPPGGERPRDVLARLAELFAELASIERCVLVTHKGVQRAAMALATGWDYRAPPPLRLRTDDALRLRLDARGRPQPAIAAVPLVGTEVPCGS